MNITNTLIQKAIIVIFDHVGIPTMINKHIVNTYTTQTTMQIAIIKTSYVNTTFLTTWDVLHTSANYCSNVKGSTVLCNTTLLCTVQLLAVRVSKLSNYNWPSQVGLQKIQSSKHLLSPYQFFFMQKSWKINQGLLCITFLPWDNHISWLSIKH